MSERRQETRPGSSDRRDIPRPSLRLNLLFLLIAIVTLGLASIHRGRIDADFTKVLIRSSRSPSELDQITAELAEMNLTQATLEKELDSRMAYIKSLQSPDFYLSIDMARKKLSLKSGNETVREAGLQSGSSSAAKGAFTVAGKKRESSPPVLGEGRYAILLADGLVIHSPSREAGPMKSPKPGSFVVSEADLKAIWGRVTREMRVYIF